MEFGGGPGLPRPRFGRPHPGCMVTSGWFIGKIMNMYPVEAAAVTVCHSGLGGTGDVAILSASNRMELMPFAQISTRIGGATMVLLATLLMKLWH